MINQLILATISGFLITALVGPRMLPMLEKLKFGQFVRDDGPESHLKKQGTPTMGGMIFLIGILFGTLIFIKADSTSIILLVATLAFACIGFLDDYLKVIKKQSEGLKAYQKFALQLMATGVLIGYVLLIKEGTSKLLIPFTDGFAVDFGWFYVPVMLIVVLGTVNGVNLTDGLDGLATSVTAVVAVFYMLIALVYSYTGGIFAAVVLGSLLGFLLLNAHPAKVFMGDTGSLALGGFVAAQAILTGTALFIVLFGIIYLIEVLSVIIQVGYYKKTKKRIFKMAPIHHHFELSGMPETRVVALFTIVTVIMSLIALLAM